MLKKLITVIGLLIVSSVTYAEPQYVSGLKVCAVQSGTGTSHVRICGAYLPKVCGAQGFVFWRNDAPNAAEMYSTALLALALDKTILIHVAAEADCANNYDRIDVLRIYK